MAKKPVAILDLGSLKINCIVAERGINHTFLVKGTGEVEYAGYKDGQFLEPDKVRDAIAFALSNAESTSKMKIQELYVGVPGEFIAVAPRECSINFNKRKKVTDADISQLYFVGNIYKKHPTHTVINVSPIYYTLDDSRRIIEPRGVASTRLGGYISYVLAENNFLDFISSILDDLGIKKVEYLSTSLAECLYLFEPDVRDRYAILVDCGHISTNVMLARGDGLLFLNSFSVAGGHISGDLARCLRISFAEAEALKRKVVLSLDATDADYYDVTGKDFIVPFPAKVTNEIVMARLSMIADLINKCFAKCEFDFPDYIPVYLTGGGLSYIKGARDFFSKKLGRKVEVIAPIIPQLSKPAFSSSFSILDQALLQNSGEGSVVI